MWPGKEIALTEPAVSQELSVGRGGRRNPEYHGASVVLKRSLSLQNIRIYASVQPLAYIPPTWRLHVEASDDWKANDYGNEQCASKWTLIAESQASRKEAHFDSSKGLICFGPFVMLSNCETAQVGRIGSNASASRFSLLGLYLDEGVSIAFFQTHAGKSI